MTATLHKLGGSNRMPVTLDLDASIGQLLARMKPLLQEEEWQLYQTRGVIVLSGDKPQSWTLDHSYTKFMACPSVQERIKAGVGLHFILHLEDVHSNQGWPCQGEHLEVPPRPHLKALEAIPHQNLEPSSRKNTINALNLEPLTTYVNASLQRRLCRHRGPGGKPPEPRRDFRDDLARLDQSMVISRAEEALRHALEKDERTRDEKAEQRTLHPGGFWRLLVATAGSASKSRQKRTQDGCRGRVLTGLKFPTT